MSGATEGMGGFSRSAFDSGTLRLGGGDIGGKAQGLVFFSTMLEAEYDPTRLPEIEVTVPPFAVLTTSVFDAFVTQAALGDLNFDELTDHEIALAFQATPLPADAVTFLTSLVEEVRAPLAVRSSSLLEDAIFHPLAGVYETKMVPNNQPDIELRLRKIIEAVRFVYASTRFKQARDYLRAVGKDLADEKMAVVIQEIVGSTMGSRFYPHVSGVARTHNFYPSAGASSEEGVVSLALGLGKTIVDGGVCWTYSPARPKAPPPFGSVGDLMKNSQLGFWAVNLSPPAVEDVFSETEHMVRLDLVEAEQNGALSLVASTYVPSSDRVVPGTGSAGPRVLNFAPLLQDNMLPLNDAIRELLAICERAAGADVEIEFAMAMNAGTERARLGFLQVRPMFVSHETIDLHEHEFGRPDLVLAASHIMGNGSFEGIQDIVHVRRTEFEAKNTRRIGAELEDLNRRLQDRGRPYLLIGFGRWGTSDPWLGVPVRWSSISGAKVIVESSLPELVLDPSQGSHFFHNVMSTGVGYLAIQHHESPGINWDWLERQPAQEETALIRHVALPEPLTIKLDGQVGRAGIWHGNDRA
ncbi:MAG TPA: PEP/pyruvate-binding domain-containing protein [Candidatus Krumholzibacteria bacterium]|nr:PEP/pyruvate-binding domain-containing protein [Candidatus Krumholzibacteria bacterium]